MSSIAKTQSPESKPASRRRTGRGANTSKRQERVLPASELLNTESLVRGAPERFLEEQAKRECRIGGRVQVARISHNVPSVVDAGDLWIRVRPDKYNVLASHVSGHAGG